ncbi:unnamed protein product [Strongylus vulgaris]|uniref:Uncharacterized protein n=1 Tax=Strongylus vulgaris TaxID=40348 RepID=A0A3P7LXD6_STRVU|nr:unnamed protein product [Strongylus vulgaris]
MTTVSQFLGSRWQQLLSDIFDKGGFDKVLTLLNLKSAGHCTLAAAIIAPIVLAFVR